MMYVIGSIVHRLSADDEWWRTFVQGGPKMVGRCWFLNKLYQKRAEKLSFYVGRV